MKKWIDIGILAVLVIGIVLISGCTSTAPVATPTPQIVYVTVLVTPTSTVARAQDPIVGTWRMSNLGYDFRYQFNSDGTSQSFAMNPNGEVSSMSETWKSDSTNSYIVTSSSGEKVNWIYIPSSDSLYDTTYPTIIYTRYQGSVKLDSSSSARTQSPTGTSSSLKYSGYGDDIKKFSVQDGGGFIITGSNSGRSNFIVHITDNKGNIVEFLFNEIGPYTGRKIVNLDPGNYFIDVQAEGSWTIDMSPT